VLPRAIELRRVFGERRSVIAAGAHSVVAIRRRHLITNI
jgi:hypothetical protein